MNFKLVAIRDLAIEAYEPIGQVRHAGQALRGFTDMINNNEMKYASHAQDYEMHELGEFDDETGKIQTYETPTRLARGSEVKQA